MSDSTHGPADSTPDADDLDVATPDEVDPEDGSDQDDLPIDKPSG